MNDGLTLLHISLTLKEDKLKQRTFLLGDLIGTDVQNFGEGRPRSGKTLQRSKMWTEAEILVFGK